MFWLADLLVPKTQDVYADLDWDAAARRLSNPDLRYPSYYLVPHHGFANGYFSPWQALGWDFVERIFRMDRVRPPLLAMLRQMQPRVVVELGCGTAGTSLALARECPEATFTGIDFSPYQLAAAERQIERAGLTSRTQVRHAAAEATGLPDASADLVLAPLLFHELPPAAAEATVREARRVLAAGGHLVIFDAIQHAIPFAWGDRVVNAVLATLLREVYWQQYMRSPVWEVCARAGYTTVERRLIVAVPWVFQVVVATR